MWLSKPTTKKKLSSDYFCLSGWCSHPIFLHIFDGKLSRDALAAELWTITQLSWKQLSWKCNFLKIGFSKQNKTYIYIYTHYYWPSRYVCEPIFLHVFDIRLSRDALAADVWKNKFQKNVRLSARPTVRPFDRPTVLPSDRPSVRPSARPSVRPSDRPTVRPSVHPKVWYINQKFVFS